MENFTGLAALLQACAPILVAIVTIIPTIINNRKKTEKSIETLQKTLDDHIKEDEDDKARQARLRILRFNDELCAHMLHSESYFEDILDDIDAYEKYCGAHPDFKNSRGKAAMEHVKSVYKKIKNNGGFLSHPQEEK